MDSQTLPDKYPSWSITDNRNSYGIHLTAKKVTDGTTVVLKSFGETIDAAENILANRIERWYQSHT